MEKLLVVLLVASATVCFLTNLLVLIILTKRRKRKHVSPATKQGATTAGATNDNNIRWNHANTFRYQIVTSQCFAGIIASCVVIYPLKVILYYNVELQNIIFIRILHIMPMWFISSRFFHSFFQDQTLLFNITLFPEHIYIKLQGKY